MSVVANVQIIIPAAAIVQNELVEVMVPGVSAIYAVRAYSASLGASGDQRIGVGCKVGSPAKWVEFLGVHADGDVPLEYTSGWPYAATEGLKVNGTVQGSAFGPAAQAGVWYLYKAGDAPTEDVRIDLVAEVSQPQLYQPLIEVPVPEVPEEPEPEPDPEP